MAMNNRFTAEDEQREQSWVSLGIVIPTLNNSMTILKTLESLDATSVGYRRDVLIVDGGSTDDTVNIAKSWHGKARVITAPPGRGSQLRHGIDEVKGDWLLLLHADTELSPRWLEEALKFMRDPAKFTTAGYFELAIQDDHWMAKLLSNWANFRSKNFGLPYGDQGLIISRVLYKKVGQLRDIPIMEDVDLARRIGSRALQHLHARARTSAERYRRGGWYKRSFINGFCLTLFLLGFEIDFINNVYGKRPEDEDAERGVLPPATPPTDDEVAETPPPPPPAAPEAETVAAAAVVEEAVEATEEPVEEEPQLEPEAEQEAAVEAEVQTEVAEVAEADEEPEAETVSEQVEHVAEDVREDITEDEAETAVAETAETVAEDDDELVAEDEPDTVEAVEAANDDAEDDAASDEDEDPGQQTATETKGSGGQQKKNAKA